MPITETKPSSERVAAIALEFASSGQYAAWYETYSETIEGFAGVTGYIVLASEAFATAEYEYASTCSRDEFNNFDVMLAEESYVDQLLLSAPLIASELFQMAAATVREAR